MWRLQLIWKVLAGGDWVVIGLEKCFRIEEFQTFHRGRISSSKTGYCSGALTAADPGDDGKFLSLAQDLFGIPPVVEEEENVEREFKDGITYPYNISWSMRIVVDWANKCESICCCAEDTVTR